jgi:hypothetical protein
MRQNGDLTLLGFASTEKFAEDAHIRDVRFGLRI